ncbi:MAG: phosphomannomutase, partial [Halobacteria archaeon]|nr:phosphomannomutase [Halobacteria archaeon]
MFGTSGVRGTLDDVSPSLLLKIGRAVGRKSERVVVGRDGRLSGGALSSAFCSGAQSAGAEVVYVGYVPTHTLAWSARHFDSVGAVITASHNPVEQNGVKLFGSDGIELGRDSEEEIERGVEDSSMAEWSDWTEVEEREVIDDYLAEAREYVGEHTEGELGLRVAVDCGNGVGALTTLPLLESLGCDVVGVNAQVDGAFPGRDPRPSDSSLEEFKQFVANGDADGGFDVGFGVAHDGDADRLVVVKPDGELVSGDAVIALLAREAVERTSVDNPTVLTTPVSSLRVTEMVEDAGGSVEHA